MTMRVCVVPERNSTSEAVANITNRHTAARVKEHTRRSGLLHYYCNGTTLVLLLTENKQKWYQSSTTLRGGCCA